MSREYIALRWIGAVLLPVPGIYLAFFLTKLALAACDIPSDGMVASCIEAVVFGMLFSMLVWKLAPEHECGFTVFYDILVGLFCVWMVVGGFINTGKFPVRDTIIYSLWIGGMIGGFVMKKKSVDDRRRSWGSHSDPEADAFFED